MEEYKCSKVRLQMISRTPETRSSRNAVLSLSTGQKWTPSDAVHQATSALRHRDIMGQVQQGRGFGLAANEPTWHKVITSEWRKMVVDEERSAKSTKVDSPAKQRQWMCWEVVERRKINWKEIHHPASIRTEPSSGTEVAQTLPCQARCSNPLQGKQLEDSHRHFPATDLSIRDSLHQSQARFGTLVHQICWWTRTVSSHGTHSSMGGHGGEGVQTQGTALR